MLHTISPSYSWGCHLSEDKPFGHVINLTLYIKYLYYYNSDIRCFICIKSLELCTKRFWLSCPPQAVAPVIIQYSSHNGAEFQLAEKPKSMQHHCSSSANSHHDGLAAPSSPSSIIQLCRDWAPAQLYLWASGSTAHQAGEGGLILAGLGQAGKLRAPQTAWSSPPGTFSWPGLPYDSSCPHPYSPGNPGKGFPWGDSPHWHLKWDQTPMSRQPKSASVLT